MKRSSTKEIGAASKTPRNSPRDPEAVMAPPQILENIGHLMSDASLEETKMTAKDVWERMRSKNAKLTPEEKDLLVQEFNNTKPIALEHDLPDTSPRILGPKARETMIRKSKETTLPILHKVEQQLSQIAAAEKLSKDGSGRNS